MARGDLPDLNIGTRGDGGLAIAKFIGNVRQTFELSRHQFAGRNPAAQHETVLRWRNVKQTTVAEAKRVFFIRKSFRLGVGQDAIPTIERMFFVFPTFLSR